MEIKVGLNTTKAMADAATLEARLRKVSQEAANVFSKSGESARVTAAGGHILQSDALMRQGARQLASMGAFPGRQMGMLSDIALSSGASRAMGMGPLFRSPPPIPSGMLSESALRSGAARAMGMGPLFPPGPNWKLGGIGAIAALFNPYAGARIMNQAFGSITGFGGRGGGRGGAGGLFGGSAEGFGEWDFLIRAIKRVTAALTNDFLGAINRGAELYTKSAMLGLKVGTTAAGINAFRAVGLPTDAFEKMVAAGQFKTGSKLTLPQMKGTIFGAMSRGTISLEEMQGLLNMSKDLVKAWNATASASRQAAESAGSLFKTKFLFQVLSAEWEAFWDQVAAVFSGSIQVMEESMAGLLHIFNAIIEFITQHKALFNAMFPTLAFINAVAAGVAPGIGESADGFKKFPIGQGVSRPTSSWEKMGLIINGGLGGTDYAKQTAENTRKIAEAVANPRSTNSWQTQASDSFHSA